MRFREDTEKILEDCVLLLMNDSKKIHYGLKKKKEMINKNKTRVGFHLKHIGLIKNLINPRLSN